MAESKSGSFIVNNNTGSFTVSINADQLTEGRKTMSVQIRRDSVRGQVIGNLSAPITINDTSFTPAGTIVSQGCVPGTYTYRVTKANGTGGTYNEDTPNSASCGYVTPPTYPVAGTVLSQGCVQGTYTYRIVKADGLGGNVNEDTPNSVACGYVAPTGPTYSIVPNVTSINEGGRLTYNVTTTGVANGTRLYLTPSGTSNWVSPLQGTFAVTINNNFATNYIELNIIADNTTEGPKTLIINLRTGSTTGPIVATAPTVTINDTSTTPAGAVLKTMNYNISMGDFATFTESGNFTGWIAGIDASNVQIDSTERSSILNNSTIRNGFNGLGLDTTALLNSVIDSFNTDIGNLVGGENRTYITEAGQSLQQSFFGPNNGYQVHSGKVYYIGTLRYLSVNYSFRALINQYLSDATIESESVSAANSIASQYSLNPSQTAQLKSGIVSLITAIREILRGVNDTVNLYDFYVKNA